MKHHRLRFLLLAGACLGLGFGVLRSFGGDPAGLGSVSASLVGLGAVSAAPAAAGEPAPDTPEGDPRDPRHWRYCAIDGFLASCCGGSHTSCPPGTRMSTITWLGTCRNPADGRDYVISYNDCCGQATCGRCFANRNEGDKPVWFSPKANDINWCMGAENMVYHSTVAIVVGVAEEADH